MSVPSEPVSHARDPRSVRSGLPAVYATDPTAQAFATAIDAMLIPVDRTLERLPDNFDAFAAPAELLPYLVRVSQARVEPSWPERAVRAAIDLAAWLAVHRGTPAALLREASVVYGWTLTVTDPGGVRLPDDAVTWPADGTLYVDLEPVQSGWDPVSLQPGLAGAAHHRARPGVRVAHPRPAAGKVRALRRTVFDRPGPAAQPGCRRPGDERFRQHGLLGLEPHQGHPRPVRGPGLRREWRPSDRSGPAGRERDRVDEQADVVGEVPDFGADGLLGTARRRRQPARRLRRRHERPGSGRRHLGDIAGQQHDSHDRGVRRAA